MGYKMSNTELNLLNALMEPEDSKKKKMTIALGIGLAAVTIIPTTLFFLRATSVTNMQDRFGIADDVNAYDVTCFRPWVSTIYTVTDITEEIEAPELVSNDYVLYLSITQTTDSVFDLTNSIFSGPRTVINWEEYISDFEEAQTLAVELIGSCI